MGKIIKLFPDKEETRKDFANLTEWEIIALGIKTDLKNYAHVDENDELTTYVIQGCYDYYLYLKLKFSLTAIDYSDINLSKEDSEKLSYKLFLNEKSLLYWLIAEKMILLVNLYVILYKKF